PSAAPDRPDRPLPPILPTEVVPVFGLPRGRSRRRKPVPRRSRAKNLVAPRCPVQDTALTRHQGGRPVLPLKGRPCQPRGGAMNPATSCTGPVAVTRRR